MNKFFFQILLLCTVHGLSGINLDERKLIEVTAANNQVIFDVGAFVGEWTDIALAYNPQARIFVFEPVKSRYEDLKKKYLVFNNISVFHLALSDQVKNVTIFNPGIELSGYYFRPGCHNKNLTEETPATSLDIFCLENEINHIDLLKIDTEGAEWDILLGALHLLASKSIDVIQFEYGGTYLDAKTTLEQVFNFLKSQEYKICQFVDGKKNDIDMWASSLENYQYTNYVAYKPGYHFSISN